MLVKGDHVFFINDYGIAGCAAAGSGEITWQQRLGGGNVTASPLLINDRVYVFTETGAIYIYAADTTAYKELSVGQLGEGIMATPAVADGRLIIRGKQSLYCFGPAEAQSK
jgi:outer membrane protein assembly factor BamB